MGTGMVVGLGLAGEMAIAGEGAAVRLRRRAPLLVHSPPLPIGSVLAPPGKQVPPLHRRNNLPFLRHGLQAADDFPKVSRQRCIPTGPAR